MIRTLFVSTSTTVGGAEKTLYTIATLLDPARHEVCGVVSVKRPGAYLGKLAAAGFTTHSLEAQSRASWKDIGRLAGIIAQARPQMVHAFMFQAIQMARIVKRWHKVPFTLVSSPRVNYRTRALWTKLVDRFLKGADDLLIAESKASRDYLVRWLGYSPDKVKIIHNGVDLAGWPVSKLERRQKRLELRLASDEVLIGAAGRLDAQKGYDTLIAAMGMLKKRPIRCVVLGEGPARPQLEAHIRRLGLERQMMLLGERDDMTSWLSALDAFVLPSRWEGLPNALLEAMAMGLPVAASAVDGVLEAVEDGKNGLLVPPGKPQALATAILRLAQDGSARSRLGAAAKETVTRRFNLIDMIAAYESAYAGLLGAPGAEPPAS
ncbi:MAG: glycosyltransferase [Elusimicrobia bacterium]|nr:glycosyltransferase [Elusimicrobiota bacterium]